MFREGWCTHLKAIRYGELMDMEAAGAIMESGHGHISLNRVERRRVSKANMANDAIVSENCFCRLWSQLADLGTSKERVRVLGVKESQGDGTGGTKIRKLEAGVQEELLCKHRLLLPDRHHPML